LKFQPLSIPDLRSSQAVHPNGPNATASPAPWVTENL
jgi:hypothetical protein